MEVIKKLAPGRHGTKRYLARFGERLVCVRYRRDAARERRLTTVELIVDEAPMISGPHGAWHDVRPHPNRHVLVRVAYAESDLRRRVKSAGGTWQPERRAWKLPYRIVQQLGLEGRVIEG